MTTGLANPQNRQLDVHPVFDEQKNNFALQKSFLFWLSLMLLIAGLFVSHMNYYHVFPQARISPAMHTRAAATFKYQEWKALIDSNKKADVVIAGSSLPMCCFYYADKDLDPKVFLKIKSNGLKLLQAYTASSYLEKKIKEKTNSKTKVFNATVAASMISDNQLILSKLMENPPQKIFLAVGMRDFADNINISFGGTPVFQSLFDLPYALSKDNLAFLFKNAKPSILEELFAGKIFPLYQIHSELGSWISDETTKLFKAEKSTDNKADTSAKIKITENNNSNSVVLKSNVKAQLSSPSPLDQLDYKQRYMPTNYKQMELEQKSLERICKLCKEKNVELILINMPVSSGHKALSSTEMRTKYLQILEHTSTKYGIKYLNFENSKLIPDEDFLDTVHMGPVGAVKFVNYLVDDSGLFSH